MRALSRDSDAGISLIEMVVAIAVLSIGLIAGFRSLTHSASIIGDQDARSLALLVARNRAGEIRLLGSEAARELPNVVTMGPLNWDVTHTEETTQIGVLEVEISVTAPQHPGAQLVVYARARPDR